MALTNADRAPADPQDFHGISHHVDAGRDRALCLAMEDEIKLPRRAFALVCPTSESFDRTLRLRLRAVDPLDERTWVEALDAVRTACTRVSADLAAGGKIHVFAWAPHPLVAFAGRCLDDFHRSGDAVFWQFDPKDGWIPLIGAAQRPEAQEDGAYFTGTAQGVWTSSRRTEGAAVLAIDFGRTTGLPTLVALAEQMGAKVIRRMAPPTSSFLRPDEVRGALSLITQSLDALQKAAPASPIYITTSAPAAIVAELGRLVRPTVFGSVVFTLFEKGRYVPVLDVAHGALVEGTRRALRVVERNGHIFYRLDGKVLEAVGPRPTWKSLIPTAGLLDQKEAHKRACHRAASILIPTAVEEAIQDIDALDVEIALKDRAALLPWEHAMLRRSERFIAQVKGWTLSRLLPERPIQAPSTGRPDRQRRVMIAPGLPLTDDQRRSLRLAEIEALLRTPNVEPRIASGGQSWVEMRDEIQAFKPHILQWVAHGGPTTPDGWPPVVEMQGQDGAREDLDRGDVHNLFADLPDLRLVILGSCSLDNLPGGVGVPRSLLIGGAGAVVSFRDDLGFGELGEFTLALYQALLTGASVRDGVAAGRRALMDPGSGYRPGAFAAPLLSACTPAALGPIFDAAPPLPTADEGATARASTSLSAPRRDRGGSINRTTDNSGPRPTAELDDEPAKPNPNGSEPDESAGAGSGQGDSEEGGAAQPTQQPKRRASKAPTRR